MADDFNPTRTEVIYIYCRFHCEKERLFFCFCDENVPNILLIQSLDFPHIFLDCLDMPSLLSGCISLIFRQLAQLYAIKPDHIQISECVKNKT